MKNKRDLCRNCGEPVEFSGFSGMWRHAGHKKGYACDWHFDGSSSFAEPCSGAVRVEDERIESERED